MPKYDVEIGIDDPFLMLSKSNSGRFSVDRQPAGINFHRVAWKAAAPGSVMFSHGPHSFGVDNVLSVVAAEDADVVGRGVSTLDVNAGVSRSEFVSHDEARRFVYGLVRSISEKGWRPIHWRNSPRLSGEDRLKYTLSRDYLNGLDENYEPNIEEWMRIEDGTPWSFYADGVFLGITLQRDAAHMDPNKPGVYLLIFHFESAEEYFKAYARPEHRNRWREILPAELERSAKERALKEAELKALGVAVDETYVDPPVPAMK